MGIVTFLLLLVKVGKVQGSIEAAFDWLKSLLEEVKSGLPPEAAEYIGPFADRLAFELGAAAEGLDVRRIAGDFVAFVSQISKGLGPPDRKAGLGV